MEVVEKLKERVPGIKFPNEKCKQYVFVDVRGFVSDLGFREVQIFVDGGVRRASDVMKAVALGANGVGIGRPFIYAYSAFGQEGVEQALRILHVSFTCLMRVFI